MITAEDVKSIIKKLPEKEFVKLRNWILERDWEKWDKEIEEDSKKGLLDFLIKEALEEKQKGKLKDL
ncbi:hypothetical protein Thein_2003 [Thermodesulfatator indicus DSM 15286]|uniref:Uncharacterized protein n=1 Tax=Thermodesulfatator indicus (strain DSM 15286 / JCM 11887 / CIR29812) TaxID=667014 RepID=F8ACZ0_THEID|nr:hypothetical protein [Thermodesulfatator indicus]AEH45856.1 hypothetical protein Thein_2003 [Thermodesulfatator indicus DSM 15286]